MANKGSMRLTPLELLIIGLILAILGAIQFGPKIFS